MTTSIANHVVSRKSAHTNEEGLDPGSTDATGRRIEQSHAPSSEALPHRLRRASSGRILAGVCGGIAEYVGMDPTLVRLAFVAATIWGGIGIVIYGVLAIVLPGDGSAATSSASHADAGPLLFILGAPLVAGRLGWTPWLNWRPFWPRILILTAVSAWLRHRQAVQHS